MKDFAESGADLINFHIETTDQVEETIRSIRALGRNTGIVHQLISFDFG